MELAAYLPFWKELTAAQQQRLTAATTSRTIGKGTVFHIGDSECLGLLVVRGGQLRAYILSEEGREVTLYRLFDRDICLFSASCMMHNIQFHIAVEAERDTEVFVISPDLCRQLTEESLAFSNYVNQLMAGRFSEVMWLIEQVMWKSVDRRLADFLLEEAAVEGSDTLTITHERIANHLGTAREVVTRMLRYFQSEGLVKLSRGTVDLVDTAGLRRLGEA